ncbi:MAG: MBL fold metallo-hydrolase [Chloroflexi bacterium]|nr:MBL fold metallo-hydrolase [Chloroflexota bacterium]
MQPILQDLFRFTDTCNVYVIRAGATAVLVDFGSGDVLDHLDEIGVERVTDVLLTHHHRDQGQGLRRAVEAGIRIWVPHVEQDLFQRVDEHWQARPLDNNYNLRQDRFSLLESVPISGTLKDYDTWRFGGVSLCVLPTPGHTPGSISLLADINDQRVAFTGDLIAALGKVWSLAATQWTYNGAEGVGASMLSLLDLKDSQPDWLLPSHGEPMDAPDAAIDALIERLNCLLHLRNHHTDLLELHSRPYEAVTPHLLKHRACVANSYVLLSDSRKALVMDFGYDFETGLPAGTDRASRRPWLHSLPMLKRQFNVDRIDVVLPTHFHDDHVAGFNLLRSVEGAQVWAAETFADVLENPKRYDLPCLWYDPIPVDCRLPLGMPVQWEEYTLTLYPLPGHTLYAVAIALEVDGRRVLVTGDQYQGGAGLELNYVYANRFQTTDYIQSAQLYRRLNPEVILSGHWAPLWVTPDYFDRLDRIGLELERLHRDLLPLSPNLEAEGFVTWLYPYQSSAGSDQLVEYQVEVRNPFDYNADVIIQVVLPEGWHMAAMSGNESGQLMDHRLRALLSPCATQTLSFQVITPPDFRARRARIAVDVTINDVRFGQQAEALVSAV